MTLRHALRHAKRFICAVGEMRPSVFPVPDWSAVLAIAVEGAEVLTVPGAKADALADGRFLLVLEAKGKSKPLPP